MFIDLGRLDIYNNKSVELTSSHFIGHVLIILSLSFKYTIQDLTESIFEHAIRTMQTWARGITTSGIQ